MKAILIIAAVFIVMCCIISIPAFEEREYAKTHPDFLKNAYDLRNASLEKMPEITDSIQNNLNTKNQSAPEK